LSFEGGQKKQRKLILSFFLQGLFGSKGEMRWTRKNNNSEKVCLEKETLYLTSQAENDISTATLSRQFFPFVRLICSIEKVNRF
jgi:hypothetical protein